MLGNELTHREKPCGLNYFIWNLKKIAPTNDKKSIIIYLYLLKIREKNYPVIFPELDFPLNTCPFPSVVFWVLCLWVYSSEAFLSSSACALRSTD